VQSEGIEVAINLPATEQIDLSLSGTVLNAEFGELIESGGVNRAGNLPQNVPGRLADLVVTYSPTALPLRVSGIARYSGSFFTSNENTVKVNAFTTFDAALTWDGAFGALTLRGRNLTDEVYADWSGYASGLVFVGAPRSVDLSYVKKY
jgi:iron complex outermembrane receptor protein